MHFEPTELAGLWLIKPVRVADERGYFARTWEPAAFAAHGLTPLTAYGAVSFNVSAGTLRGLHFQAAPKSEAKLVRCTRGAMFDVVLDLRPGSATFLRWAAFELTADNHHMVYVPEGCAHGFLTLVAQTEVSYQLSMTYEPGLARGVRWDDPAFGIAWPFAPKVIAERDCTYADFRP